MREYRTYDLGSRLCWPEEQEEAEFRIVKPSVPASETTSQIRDFGLRNVVRIAQTKIENRTIFIISNLDAAETSKSLQ